MNRSSCNSGAIYQAVNYSVVVRGGGGGWGFLKLEFADSIYSYPFILVLFRKFHINNKYGSVPPASDFIFPLASSLFFGININERDLPISLYG